MNRRWVILCAAILVVLLVVGVVFLLRTTEIEDAPEQVAARFSRTPVTADGPPADLGSGQSATGAWYELAFTSPKYPDNRANHQGGLDERLVALVGRTQRTLDVAIYDFDLANVAEALSRAVQRGVRVRMVTDSDTVANKDNEIQAALATVKAARIPIVEDNRRPIMHDKFVVADGEWVLTGSWNFTDGDTYRLNNHAIVIQSRDLAENYTGEFEKMFAAKKFGAAKAAGVPHPTLNIAGSRVENYFSPKDNVAAQVIRWVGTARQQLHFMAFSFTHDGIGDAMLERARAGVQVGGVFETTGSETQFSEFRRMKQAGLDVLQDGSPWVMHHKVILIDGRVVIFGSFNFSSNADRDNDENLLIVEDPGLASAFEAEYQRMRQLALNPPVRR